jgi:hypothetical protein
MKKVPIINQPKWPAMDAETHAAFLDFKLIWKSTGEPVKFEDAAQQYRFTGHKATAQLEASVRVPSLHFSWTSDPLANSSAEFAVIGEEVNGRYYTS